ncbi:hypothetical protein F5B17DRAFT_442540 [Nemania serpens]|nr:hypothetical protein F5B17DRAFT_442540 [Nemania serpens]
MGRACASLPSSTLTRPRTAIAITLATAVAAASLASLGYHYYRQRYSPEQLGLDAPDSGPGSGSRLRRRNALRRLRRSEHQRDEQDESSGSESHDDDQVDPLDGTTSVPAEAEQPDDGSDDPTRNARQRTGENIVTLLFRVSEDNARRNAYVHRGCLCNGCGMLPIRGIRYRCANCPDFDLCEMCESQGCHNKAHIFYKVKIPVPSSAARQVQPPWYPGDPNSVQQTLPRELLAKWSHETGFERVELDALWEQWTFMANTEWREDPNKLGLAMDRKTFERCLVPSAGYRHPAPNLIHDRMFAFYDTNQDDLIGFEEYLQGVSYKRRKDKLRRTFDGYDVDGDGYVNRRDFLRMYRAYYVSYKQMHRDTVEGLDDYMMTNVEVQQLVNGRQPISGLFGREQRIPDGEGGRHMEGKIFRPGGEVDVQDGKGAVSEDKPDASSREDILRDLFTRTSNPSPFTETFGFSRRPQSPSRDSPYWLGILNPPRDTVEMGALLSGDNAQLDGILDSIRRRESRVLIVDEDDDSSSSEDDDNQGTPYDRIEDEGELGRVDEDANPITSPGLLDAGEFIHTLPTEISLRPQQDTFANPQQLNSEKRKRVMARRKLYERWKRRQFYLDEEEGVMPPQGWRHEQDTLAHMNHAIEPSKSAPPLLSPRSRSSSKVRFAEDTDDFETRSNHSTSSRSVPERWGGMEIPDAERDAGKEILYQVTQQAFNELLDILFKEKEDLAVEAVESKEQREKHRQLLDSFSARAEDDRLTEPGSPGQPPMARHSPIMRTPQQQNLDELLSASGYTIASPNGDDEEGEREVIDENVERQNDTSESVQLMAASSANSSASALPEHRDPTMPQFMPSHAPDDNDKNKHFLASSTLKIPTSDHDTPSETRIDRPGTPSSVPSHDTLMVWKLHDQAEQEAKVRGGWGRLSYAEFEEIYREHEFQDGSKNRLAYLGSWIDFCIPS